MLINCIVKTHREEFHGNADESFSSVLKNWYEKLKLHILQNVLEKLYVDYE